MLPSPTNSRFQPLRSGLINLFKYQEQEFWYERGRLLIRGNNGTGKSRVLALQLPFLLDGEISSRRVEPDGDPARQIAWHLLMDEHDQRTGYTWIEFGRRDETGAERYLTLGCGMRAIRGGDNQPTRWFFITERRVGRDFMLLDGAHPLSADRLAEVLGQECFYKIARDYRAEIDRRLFSLGKERYEALIELLIRLRAPQLSKKLEERAIFAALSDALPPLSSDVVKNVADAFKQLDELREQFATLQGLFQSLAAFQSGYQAYLQVALLRRAEQVRSRHSRYEDAQQGVTRIERSIETASSAKAEAVRAMKQAGDHCTSAEARYEALTQSSAAGDAQRLDDVKRTAEDKAAHNGQAAKRAQDAEDRLQAAERDVEQHSKAHGKHVAERDAASAEASKLARPAGFAADYARLLPDAAAWQSDHAHFAKLKSSHARLAGDHLHRLDQIDAGLAAVKDAQSKLMAAQSAENQWSEKAEAHRVDVRRHDEDARAAVGTLAAEYAGWHSQLRRLSVPPWSDLAPAFDEWMETADDSQRLLDSCLARAMSSETAAIATARADLKTKRDHLSREQDELVMERASLATAPPPPVAPPTRDQASRAGRPGAPLWQVCEFHPHLSAGQRAGLEAALEASGLLDAWITPDGTLAGDFPNDTFFDAVETQSEAGARGPTLAEWLIPDAAMESGTAPVIAPATLQRVLRRIGAGAGTADHWVALDGRWRLGPVVGRGGKSEAQHLGAASREIARQRRLAEIESALSVLSEHEAAFVSEAAQLDEREKETMTERSIAPGDHVIARYLTLRTNARQQLDEASAAHSEAVQKSHRAREMAREVADRLREDARHLGYLDHLDRLAELRPAWNPYELAATKLWGHAQAWITSAVQMESLTGRQRVYAEDQARESELARAAHTSALHAEETFKALQQALGSSVSDFQVELQSAREARADVQKALEAARSNVLVAETTLATLQSSLQPAQGKVSEAGDLRDQTTQALRVPLLHGLFSEAHPSLADIETDVWSPTRAYAIARRLGKELPYSDHSDEAWTKRLNGLENQIHDLRTRTGTSCEIESQVLSEGLTMVICRYQGLRLKPAECLAAVGSERETHERLLDAGERDIIDRHLITEVSLQLQTLIENARQRTDQMNEEMTRCATTLGVTLRLGWEPLTEGLPPGLPAVRKLLLVDHASWSADERTTVGRFLHQLIQNERIGNPAATAAEQLLRALDYRQWHLFYAERRQNDRWERLTKKRYGTGSGGEKALMLTIPQMAAAASHYRTAAAHAPRFILLDEAFAGLDPPTRARLMGLLEAFDLDLLMTSEREWGTHATVPGIAIYQLVADADAVAATRWLWNGRAKLLAPVPDTPDLRSPAFSLTSP